MVESPCDAALIPDGAALSAFQYFENVRNFLVAVQEMGLPTFEASDLEQVCFAITILQAFRNFFSTFWFNKTMIPKQDWR